MLENADATSLLTPYLEGLTAPQDFSPAFVVAVDLAARSLFPKNAQSYLERVDLTIDHHPSQEFYAQNTCLDAKRAACGELIYDIVRQWGPLSQRTALPLYVALATDCGCFVYSNTNASAHRVAAALMETGIDVYPINRLHFRSKSLKRLKLEGQLTAGMELRDNGETALVFLTRAMIDAIGADERDMDNISAFVGQIEGVKNGVTLKETVDGQIKISVRTDPGDLNASKVCALLGGGGHAAAAGAAFYATMDEARQRVLDAIQAVRNG